MKKVSFYSALTAIAVILILVLATTAEAQQRKPKKVKLDCDNYKTDKEFFRNRFVGQSQQEDVAMKIGKANAREELATMIKDEVKKVGKDFLNSYGKNMSEELERKFITLTIQVVDATIYNSYSVCEECRYDKKGKFYKYSTAMEMAKADYVKELERELKKDDELKINFEMEKFEDDFWKILNKDYEN